MVNDKLCYSFFFGMEEFYSYIENTLLLSQDFLVKV